MVINDRIGIDTHGYDEPPDEPELSPEDEERLSEIEQEIADLVKEYTQIVDGWPTIEGYLHHNWVERLRSNYDELVKQLASETKIIFQQREWLGTERIRYGYVKDGQLVIYHTETPQKTKSKWLCDTCYDLIGKEAECYTDVNWLRKRCEQCGKIIATHHLCDGSLLSPPNDQ